MRRIGCGGYGAAVLAAVVRATVADADLTITTDRPAVTESSVVSAFLSFPTGAHSISSHGYDPGVQLLDRQLTTPCDAFIEYAADFPQRGGSSQLLHVGTAYKLAPRQQIDLHAAFGLSAAAPRSFIGVG
jgi:hypothetical protein